jgi:signal transduction histidine kinase
MINTFNILNKLSRRLLTYILLCSILFSICSTLIQLYNSFQNDVRLLDQRFDNIEKSYIPSMATSLWDFNESLIDVQLKGIVDLPNIRLVKISNDFDYQRQLGQIDMNVEKVVEYPITYLDNVVGKLIVYADYQEIYQKLYQQAGFILLSETIKIFLLTFFILFIVNLLITRHLFHITKYTQQLGSHNLDQALTISNRFNTKDELDYLVDAINVMRINLQSEISKLEDAENALLALNGELEVKVHDRTAMLAKSNNQLQQSFDDLTLAKDKIVQSEKMASLGQLVAGVAHEVNTPLGICITSITALSEHVDSLQSAISNENLTKSFLVSKLNLLKEYEQIIERSLIKSVDLIQSFKSVAVEQHTDPEVDINLAKHVKNVVNTVKTMFKTKNYSINIDVDEKLSLVTYPSAWNQILTNFMVNSHIHGFENSREGEISISFTQENGYLTLLYQDNGKGISDEVNNKVFEPFITTKRGQGGSGLGLNIVFNLVDAKLGGTIENIDVDKGACFKVKVPIHG